MLISTGKEVRNPTLVAHLCEQGNPCNRLAQAGPASSGQTSKQGRAPTHRAAAAARGAQPHASPAASDGNSLHTQLLILATAVAIFCQSFRANLATTAPKWTTAYVHHASRAPAGYPTRSMIAAVSPCQDDSHWEVSSPTSTSKQGQPTLLMALSSLEACCIPLSKGL